MKTFIKTITLAILGAIFIRAFADPASATEVLEYRFEDRLSTRATDTSGRGNHGTPLCGQNVRASGDKLTTTSPPRSCPLRYAASQSGHGFAASLDGLKEFINIGGNRPDFNNLTSYTAMAWINLKADRFKDEVLEKGAAFWMNILTANNNVRGGGFYGGCDPSRNFDNTDGAVPVRFGEWTHVASTYNGRVLIIYVNGQRVGQKQVKVPGSVCSNTRPLAIGAKNTIGFPNGVNQNFLGGLIDDVRVYKNEVLSESQIQQRMLEP
jgi:hypothetical protein